MNERRPAPGKSERRRTVGLRESRPAAVDPVPLNRRPAPAGDEVVAAVVGVQFRAAGLVYDFDSGDVYYGPGAGVVVETDRGPVVGTVVRATERRVQPVRGLLRVLRGLDDNDSRARRRNVGREDLAFCACLEMVRDRGLTMKLVWTEYAHSGSKVVFYFASEERVDFRELVRALSERLHVRVEMRQLGVRDRSKMVGGIGSCGRELCCATWLREFVPITIKMAKDQNLALNPQKVSGQCGRLKCCLAYEECTYRTMRKGLPKVGRTVVTPKGEGRVREVDVLRGLVRVMLEGGIETFSTGQVARPGEVQARARPEPTPARAEPEVATPPAPEGREDPAPSAAPRRRRRRSRGSGLRKETPKPAPARRREPSADTSGRRRRRRRRRDRDSGGDSGDGRGGGDGGGGG